MIMIERFTDEVQADAEATGIIFGWEVASLLVGPAVCLAACQRCEGLSARAELPNLPGDQLTRRAVQLDQEGRVWQTFKMQALYACCEHLLDYLAHKGAFVLPVERVKDYRDELSSDEDKDACDLTGIAFGATVDGGFISGCDRCEYARRLPPSYMAGVDPVVTAHIVSTRAVQDALSKTCAHYFRWLSLREAEKATDDEKIE